MSYCVHCGVELADRETACPLCGTPVLDPHRATEREPMPEDKMEDVPRRLNRRFVVLLVSAILLVPFIVTFIVGQALHLGMTWPAFVIGAEICFWVFFVLPFLVRLSPLGIVLTDTATAALYLLFIAYLTGGLAWYLPLVLPITVLTGITAAVTVLIAAKPHITRLGAVAWSFVSVSLLPGAIDMTVTHFRTGSFLPTWGWFVTVPMLVLGIVLVVISRSRRMTEWIRRKMFI